MQHIFIIGSKGIPASYGGYETFVEKLTNKHSDNNKIKYHIACKSTNSKVFQYNNARCFNVKVPNIGPIQAVYYDIKALKACIEYIRENNIKEPIIYILACRIGPWIKHYKKIIKKIEGKLYVNPDGHEWLRMKWNVIIRKYWKISESLMVKNADLLICDSKNIELYILHDYKKYNPNTTYIAYGTDIYPKYNHLNNDYDYWYDKNNISRGNYYLVVGRFVPENNYETMIREFMRSKSKKNFILITNVNSTFLNKLKKTTKFHLDSRIKFVGTVYDSELLLNIRSNAFAYFHGHEVGGTNPSLLESLASTKLNLLLDVGFNREVALDSALYWTKNEGELEKLINNVDNFSNEKIDKLANNAVSRVEECYTWDYICECYERLFLI